MLKRMYLPLAVLMTLLMVVTGCSPSQSVPSDYMAIVNGVAIPYSDYEQRVDDLRNDYTSAGYEAAQIEDYISMQVMETLIQAEIIHQETERQQWDLQAEGVTAQVDDLKAQIIAAEMDYDTWLTTNRLTDTQVREVFAFQYYVGNEAAAVTEEEVQTYFEQNKETYDVSEQVKASHILVETEDEAQQLIDELQDADLVAFSEVAKEKSIDPSAALNNGDLGYFDRETNFVPEFLDAAFSQEVGVISERPVQTSHGFHVIYVEEHTQAKEAVFEELEDTVRADALEYYKNLHVNAYYEEVRNNADVQYAEALDPAKAEESGETAESATVITDETGETES